MSADLIADLGHLFLGSRLKRLAERLQTDAAKVHRAMGIDAQPAELALLAALDRYGPLTITSLVDALGVSQPGVTRTASTLGERGLIGPESEPRDPRHKTLALTDAGRALVEKAKSAAWPAIDRAVAELCAPLAGTLLDQLAGLEAQLAERPLEARALAPRTQLHRAPAHREVRGASAASDRAPAHREVPGASASDRAPAPVLGPAVWQAVHEDDAFAIRDYSDDLARAFYDINAEWISDMFRLEEKDRQILMHPRETILEPGGFILFGESTHLGVIGTCALMKVAPGVFELTKMGVLERARGRRAGELLLEAALARASAMNIELLYLLTNSKCVSAIRLYEKLGFVHDAEILAKYGPEYARCDVAMRYPL